jgi:nucleotide-binding universal stress UspA family protein
MIMKTILVPTDFSQPAYNAARYALELAKILEANVKLCHAFKVPAEAPMAAQVAWPLENYSTIQSETEEELRFLAEQLSKETVNEPSTYQPLITYSSDIGSVAEVVRNLVNEEKLILVIMGTYGSGGLSHFLLGSSSRDMIQKACFPLLLIPQHVKFKRISKIGFATDLTSGDIEIVNSLTSVARMFNAEILISHVTNEKFDDKDHQNKIDSFLNDVTCKINYPKIYYRHIKHRSVDLGLDWISEHGQIDMLVMVHRQHHILNWIFQKGHTQKLATHIELPLLVFPEGFHSII